MDAARETHRCCALCEASCGITVRADAGRVVSLRGDEQDPFSRGFICPKAYGLKGLHEDPDRLQRPVRRVKGGWQEISWNEAFELSIDGLLRVRWFGSRAPSAASPSRCRSRGK